MVLDESVERFGDDAVAARSQMDGFLIEDVRSRKRAAERR